MIEIDFVVTWVDNTDQNWVCNYNKYRKLELGDSSSVRFRNWNNFHYWLRGVEKFAPWVRKVHLVTAGHLPKWLNVNHEKLNIIKHEEYIENEYLPTFNSVVIENSIHLVEEISEKFVLFNDDFFITSPVDPERFFKNELPCDMAVQNALSGDGNSAMIMNMLSLINANYNKRDVVYRNLTKWFNLTYKEHLLKNILLAPWPNFTGFVEPHMPQPYLKSSMRLSYEKYKSSFMSTNKYKFRNNSNINHYLFRYEQLMSGNFIPSDIYSGVRYYDVNECNFLNVCEDIESNRNEIVVINDSNMNDFDMICESINNSFSKIFPEKSSFEK